MKGLKGVALILALALIGLSLVSRFTEKRSAESTPVANEEAMPAKAVARNSAEPDQRDLAVKQELRKEFTLQPNALVYVRGINGRVEVETSNTDKAEVYLVRSARQAEDFEERNVNIRLDDDGDLIIDVRSNRERSVWAELGSRHDERQRLLLKLPRKVRFEANNIHGDTTLGELDGSLHARGLQGSLKAARVTTAAELVGINGNIDITFANVTKSIYTRGINGNLDLRFADAVNADIEISGHNGQINNELPNTTVKQQKHGRFGARIGNGGVMIEGRGINGNFNLLAAAKMASK